MNQQSVIIVKDENTHPFCKWLELSYLFDPPSHRYGNG